VDIVCYCLINKTVEGTCTALKGIWPCDYFVLAWGHTYVVLCTMVSAFQVKEDHVDSRINKAEKFAAWSS
jgi:hypothetical protein